MRLGNYTSPAGNTSSGVRAGMAGQARLLLGARLWELGGKVKT